MASIFIGLGITGARWSALAETFGFPRLRSAVEPVQIKANRDSSTAGVVEAHKLAPPQRTDFE